MIKNMKIKNRLLLFTSLVTLALFVIALVGILGSKLALDSVHTVYTSGADSMGSLGEISSDYEMAFTLAPYNTLNGLTNWEETQSLIEKALLHANKQLEIYKTSLKNNEELEQLPQLEEVIQKSVTISHRLIEILKMNDRQSLLTFWSTDLARSANSLHEEVHNLLQMHTREIKQEYEKAIERFHIFEVIIFVIILITFASFMGLSLWIIRSITVPLKDALKAIEKVSTGDINVKLENPSQDEIGQLVNSIQTMIDSNRAMIDSLSQMSKGDLSVTVSKRSKEDLLGETINALVSSNQSMVTSLAQVATGDLTSMVQVRSDQDLLGETINEMVTKLETTIGETKDEIQVLTSSCEEINASVTQVSTGIAETAAAVTETTTTVEELRHTAQISAEKSKDVLSFAEETLKTVKASEQSVKATLEDMSQIQDRVRIVSDTIIKLNEHSLAIGEIINTVNELAEQSNLLAVNAAIEAAKAGDQGKSFGVVAQEIRTLAEQSKGATVQVRAILNDIQNSTSAAVLASEQGSKAVSKGVSQSSQTSVAMSQLSSSISNVAQAAKQISISSHQQLIGVEQVTTAMTNINEATGQHVEHMKQIENAVSALANVSYKLERLTDKYKLRNVFHNENQDDESSYSSEKLYPKSAKRKKSKHVISGIRIAQGKNNG